MMVTASETFPAIRLPVLLKLIRSIGNDGVQQVMQTATQQIAADG